MKNYEHYSYGVLITDSIKFLNMQVNRFYAISLRNNFCQTRLRTNHKVYDTGGFPLLF